MASREPNSVEVTPSGIEIAFFDSVGVDGKPQQRRYLIDGKRYPSATTILNVLSKGDGLLYWVAGLVGEGKDWREERERAALRGSAAHSLLLQTLVRGRAGLADLPDDQRAYGQAAFRWILDRDPQVDLIERMVASPRHGYAGRLDLIADIGGIRTLCDWKTVTKWPVTATGKRRPPYDENLLQLDLYQGALLESGYQRAERGLIVRLGPDGDYDETFCHLNAPRGLAILPAFNAKKTAGRALREARKRAEVMPK